jgi:ATP-dependent 26S proteasome regulatory subunit
MTAMYLASALKNHTTLIVTGRSMSMPGKVCELARWLQPAMIIIEDIDLIAEERSQQRGTLPLLYELMNQMDGLTDDADILFLLTTNRPDVLEPALASRPGRIDQAYEIPLPDHACRERLFNLYSEGLRIQVEDLQSVIRRTNGASAAFIAEVMRKASLFAFTGDDNLVVTDKHISQALHELLFAGGSLTKNLLGFREIGFNANATEHRSVSARQQD